MTAHVLVVDDVADNRNLLAQLLRRAGYRVSEAQDGQEALERIRQDPPDLLLLDLMMPVLDGFGVLERLKDRPPGPFLPVVVVSAATEREARLRALGLGANEVLAKPIDPEELAVRIRTLLELRESKERIRHQAEQLEQEVARRTQEIQAANAELKASNRYKDEFLAVVSHELKTPLNFIMGFASLLADEVPGPVNEEQRGSLKRILKGADRMLGLVNDLLDYAQLRAGKLQLHRAPMAVLPLLMEVVTQLRPVADRKGVSLSAQSEGEGRPRVDGRRLVQVLLNLVDNAIKFTPKGGSVTVRAWQEEQQLVCEVQDTGIGISPADQGKLFRPFQQLDMSHTRASGGTGLGLVITKALVEAHGGALTVRSESGQGSTFRVTIPLDEAPPERGTA